MAKRTIAEALDVPFHWINHAPGAERWARGMVRLEPIPTNTVEYAAAISDDFSPEPYFSVDAEDVLRYSEGVSRGVRSAAEKKDFIGVRVTLTQIEAHPVDSSRRAYETAAFRAVCAAAEAHGVPISG